MGIHIAVLVVELKWGSTCAVLIVWLTFLDGLHLLPSKDFVSSLKYGELQLLFKTKLGQLFYVNKKLQKPPCCHLVNIQIVQIWVF